MVAPPPAPPPVTGGLNILSSAIVELDRAVAQEKASHASKVKGMLQDPNSKNKWSLFCKAHGGGNTSVEQHDQAFLMTFLESFEAGTILDEPPASQGWGDNKGGSWSNQGGNNNSSDGGNPAKLFVGGLAKGTTEDNLWQYFQQWGPVDKVDSKKDDDGNPKGFAFVTFKDPAHAKQVLDNKDYNKINGKWIDCKLADNKDKGGGKGGKDGKDGKDGKGGKDKGGKDGKDSGKGDNNWQQGGGGNNNWQQNNNNNNNNQGGGGGWNNNNGGGNNWGNNNNNGGGSWNNGP